MGYADLPQSQDGWRDYANDFGYPKHYDCWDKNAQRNYENGRMRAANYKAAFNFVPLDMVSFAEYHLAIEIVGVAFEGVEGSKTYQKYSDIPKTQQGDK